MMNQSKEKTSNYSSKDVANIKDLLKSQGITEYDPEIIPKLLDVVFQLSLKTARGCDNYAKSFPSAITADVVKFAAARLDDCARMPIQNREDLLNFANTINASPLPPPTDGVKNPLKLPPPNTCLFQPEVSYEQPKCTEEKAQTQFHNFNISTQPQIPIEQNPNMFPFVSTPNPRLMGFPGQINPNLR